MWCNDYSFVCPCFCHQRPFYLPRACQGTCRTRYSIICWKCEWVVSSIRACLCTTQRMLEGKIDCMNERHYVYGGHSLFYFEMTCKLPNAVRSNSKTFTEFFKLFVLGLLYLCKIIMIYLVNGTLAYFQSYVCRHSALEFMRVDGNTESRGIPLGCLLPDSPVPIWTPPGFQTLLMYSTA